MLRLQRFKNISVGEYLDRYSAQQNVVNEKGRNRMMWFMCRFLCGVSEFG